MGINGPKATACYGGLGTFVSRGENRVNDLECHANCLRERLDRLEAMLPSALIEASIAIQKGERPPDLLQLTTAEEERQEEIGTEGKHKRAGELPCVISECGQALAASNMIEAEDEPRVCMLQVLARKEKRLRKKIYEMELKEERYKKALAEADQALIQTETSGAKNNDLVCPPQCPGTKNQTMMAYRVAATSQDPYDEDPVKQRIQQLEASSKKIGQNLKNLHRERTELTCQAKNLTEELRCTQKCLGQVQQRVLGSSSSQVIPIMGDPSLDDVYENGRPCCARPGNCGTKLPQDPEALRALAGQFKEAYKKAENEGFSPSVREPIRKTADRLRALSNLDPNACPCGQPVKCDSCIICTCAEWERDLEGGGDEHLEQSSSDGEGPRRGKSLKNKGGKDRKDECHCGCNETSSESECPCGCSNLQVETANICPCSCDQTIESSAMSTSDPSTMTDSTIPSSETDDSGYHQVGRGDDGCASSCVIFENEDPQKSETTRENVRDDQCEICQCETLNDSPNMGNLCTICPCTCTMCSVIENRKGSPPCQLNRSIIEDAIISQDSNTNPVECTCLPSSEVPPQIQKVCKVDKLREGLENLKNRNHAMRNILKSCGRLSPVEDSSLSPTPRDTMVCECSGAESNIKQTPSGLMCTVRLLQNKCRTKDGMIVALANELKKAATPEQTSRILECLADPTLCCDANDFDRSELWNYLKTSSSNNHRVSGRKTCHRDLLIGLTVLFLIVLSHVVRSYSVMPPFSEVLNSLKYWMDEIPGNLGYLINFLAHFARILFQKQCFMSLLQCLGPFSTYLDSLKAFFSLLPGMQTVMMLANVTCCYLDSSSRSLTALAQSLRNLQLQLCTRLCKVVEYLNVVKRCLLFQKTHLPSLKAAMKSSGSFASSCLCLPKFSSITDLLPKNAASSLISFSKIFFSHVLCLWAFVAASPSHMRGLSSLLLYLCSCVISLPGVIQIALERSFEFLLRLVTRCGIQDRVLPSVSKFLSNVISLVESCCCSGANSPCGNLGVATNPRTSCELQNADLLADKKCASLTNDVNSFLDRNFKAEAIDLRKIKHGFNDRVPNASQSVKSNPYRVLQDDLGDSKETEQAQADCYCPVNPKHPEPPRKLTVRGRVSGDGLIISWLPPLSGSVAGYEVFAEGEIVGRIRTPMRTETFVGGLDLRGMVLLEVRTISTNGLRSGTVEKLFNPARSDV